MRRFPSCSWLLRGRSSPVPRIAWWWCARGCRRCTSLRRSTWSCGRHASRWRSPWSRCLRRPRAAGRWWWHGPCGRPSPPAQVEQRECLKRENTENQSGIKSKTIDNQSLRECLQREQWNYIIAISLSQQGVWASFGHPNPLNITIQDTQKRYLRNFSKDNFKHIIEYIFHLDRISMKCICCYFSSSFFYAF